MINIIEHNMEKKSLVLSLVSLIVIANALLTPIGIEIDGQVNILSKIQTTMITPVASGIEDQENIWKYMQCYGYYGC